ncbi:DeoR/GlpR family DNA-binding transcription regulator [Parafrankia discariae]|uniref:hypothetical protein n=1 Tax=Parafrankia discariae TaxID=365528 RepID=UPI000363D492|nr:hypothetical protein [Parafrankia discariae]
MGSRGPPVHDALLIGGRLFRHSAVTCGAAAAEAAMKRTLARQTADTYVLALASSEKIGTASPFTVLPVASVSGLITDATDDRPVIAELLKQERRS